MALTTLTQSDQKRSDVLGLWFYLTTAKAQLAAAQDVGDLGTSIPGTWPSLGDGVAESWLSKALDPTDDLHLALANARGPWNLYTSTSNVGWNSIARAALGADATPNLIMQVWLLLMTRYDIRTAAG
jgi:hypothetical protein